MADSFNAQRLDSGVPPAQDSMSLPLHHSWRPVARALCAALLLCSSAVAATDDLVAAPQAGWNLQTLQALADERGMEIAGLAHAWQLAQENDPEYQIALNELRAAQTMRRQGRSNLLPQVQAGHYRGRIRGERTILNAPPARARAILEYDSETTYIQLQQPVLNYGRFAEYRRGVALAEEGEAQFLVDERERLIALAEAYFAVLLAYGQLELDQALAESLAEQAKAQDASYEQAEATRIDVQEVEARLSLAKAEAIRSRDALKTAQRELQAILGTTPQQLGGLGDTFRPAALSPASLPEWLKLGRSMNAELRAARARLRVADANVGRARARHLPALDLVANWTKADSENLSTLSQNSNTYSIGLNLEVPIFSGGYDTAVNERVRAEQRQASQELQAATEQVAADIVRHYTAVTGGAQRMAALEAAAESSERALHAVTQSYKYGLSINVDVLKQRDSLYRAKHELLQSRFDYLLSLIELWVASGVLDTSRLRELDRFLSGSVTLG